MLNIITECNTFCETESSIRIHFFDVQKYLPNSYGVELYYYGSDWFCFLVYMYWTNTHFDPGRA